MNPANPEETGTLKLSRGVAIPLNGGNRLKHVSILRLRDITLAEATEYTARFKRSNPGLSFTCIWIADPIYLE